MKINNKEIPVGEHFGRWTVLSEAESTKGGERWRCLCDCGTVRDVRKITLTRGESTSCGCKFRELTSKRLRKDISGHRFGSLVAVKDIGNSKEGAALWLCKCDCGNEKAVRGNELRKGHTNSCGLCPIIYDKARLVRIYKEYIRGAESRGIYWGLTEEDVHGFIHKNCFYCDSPPANNRKIHRVRKVISSPNTSGIDRVDSTKGYTLSNCVPCCKICNRAKNNMPIEQFIEWVDRLRNSQNIDNIADFKGYAKNNLVKALEIEYRF